MKYIVDENYQMEEQLKQPDISIIVPVYNSRKYLSRCISSLQDQTLRNIEIILVDDGSTDDSLNICNKIANEDSRFHVYHKANEGQGIARNYGMSFATGRYICFLDSDDEMDLDAYRKILENIERSSADLCSFGYCKIDNNGGKIYTSNIKNKTYNEYEMKYFVLHFFGDDLSDNDMRGVSACMTCYKRSIIESFNVKFPSEREVLSEDTIFNLRYCSHCSRAVAISDALYHYYIHSNSYTQNIDIKTVIKAEKFGNTLSEYAAEFQVAEMAQSRIATTKWYVIMECIKQMCSKESNRELHLKMKSFLNNEHTRNILDSIGDIRLNAGQRLLLYFAKRKMIISTIVITKIRLLRGA